ncbi:FACT complex subunit [Aphelenchoides fujianensis]|nr:FACT complex subunit [Aphelenchoides fujianensis]
MGSLKVDKNYFVSRASRFYDYWNSEDDETLNGVGALCFAVGPNVSDGYSKSQSLQDVALQLQHARHAPRAGQERDLLPGQREEGAVLLAAGVLREPRPVRPRFTVLHRDKASPLFSPITHYFCSGHKGQAQLRAADRSGHPGGRQVRLLREGEGGLRVLQAVGVQCEGGGPGDRRRRPAVRPALRRQGRQGGRLDEEVGRGVRDRVELPAEEVRGHRGHGEENPPQAAGRRPGQGDAHDQRPRTPRAGRLAGALLHADHPVGPRVHAQVQRREHGQVHPLRLDHRRPRAFATPPTARTSARTMMVEPTSEMEEIYELILSAQNVLLEHMKPNTRICDSYRATLDFIKEKKPELVQYLVKSNFGFATGIEFRESQLLINDKCQQLIRPNMTFVIILGVQNFDNPRAKDSDYKTASMLLSDTILIAESGTAEVLTHLAKNRFRSNSIRFRNVENAAPRADENVVEGRSKRSVILQEQTRHKQTNEDKRKDHQRELADQLNEAAKARLAHAPGAENVQRVKKSNTSYKNQEKFPNESEVNEGKIYVDKKHDSVIFPIFGMPVPFHISMLKNTSLANEGDYIYLRINFTHPGSQIGKDNLQFPNPLADFVKEMTFRSSNAKEPGEMNPPSLNLQTAYRLIKEMQKRYRTMEAELREKEGAVKQDKLIVNNGKGNPKLKEIYVRPNIITKRVSGWLEAHVNGFRYNTNRGDKIDVLYNNIKHAFFQPCDNEMIILLHFHLKNPVLWGKKKNLDIQFYTEVGEITTDLGKMHHMQDRDDMINEQKERDMRKRLNVAFQAFCEKVARATNDSVDFETPFNELGFTGVPFRSSVTLKPTSSCLVSLTEMPPLVIALDDVELVHFERVTGNTRSFDMVIVFKDYSRKTQQISHIPGGSLDSVKDWLNSCDIRYSEGPISLNWNNIMKTIVQDPDQFFEDGGWNFLLNDDVEEGEEEESEESEFEPTDDDDAEETEESDTGATEESESEASLGSDESEGKDWSDLEEEAAKADRAKERGEDEPADRKRKGGRPTAPPPKRRR